MITSFARVGRRAASLLPLLMLTCVDAPAGGPRRAAGDDTARPSAAALRQSAAEERMYRGAYRRTSSTSQFVECGSQQPLDVRGRPEALTRLRDRYRWNAVQMNRPLFAVFRGAIVTDSAGGRRGGVGDSAAAPVRYFQLASPESLRAWREGDCGLSHPPRW